MLRRSLATSRRQRFWSLVALVAGNMMGSGMFVLPASLAPYGTQSLWAWTLTGLGALSLAMIFSNLSVLNPDAGGPATYVRQAFGALPGFVTAWCYWVAVWVGNAATAIAMMGYVSALTPSLWSPMVMNIGSLAVVWGLTWLNCRGVQEAQQFQLITLVFKLFPIAMVLVLGWWWFHPTWLMTHAPTPKAHHPVTSIAQAASLTLWAFVGLESATVPKRLTPGDQELVPKATVVGTAGAALIYLFTCLVLMGMVHPSALQHDPAPLTTAAQVMLGDFGKYAIALGAVVACLGSLNGWILLQGQMLANMASHGNMPRALAYHNDQHAPVPALLFSSVLVTAIVLMHASSHFHEQFNRLILLAVLSALLPYFLTALAHIPLTRGLHLPRWKRVLNVLGLVYSAWMLITIGFQTPGSGAYGLGLVGAGIVLFALNALVQRRRHRC